MSSAHRSRIIIESPGLPGLYQLAPLPGWTIIGTVTDATGTGVLVRNNRTGVYCRANAGELRSLPQAKVKAALDALD